MPRAPKKPAQFLIPEPITGYPEVCVSFRIPNHPLYVAAWQATLNSMRHWRKWEHSGKAGDTRATQAARYVWEMMVNSLQFRLCNEEGRVIELRAIALGGSSCQEIQWKYTDENQEAWRYLATVCNGNDGEPGEQGMPGEQGPQGLPGECPDCPDPENPDYGPNPEPGEGENSKCLAAESMTQIVRDSIEQGIKSQKAGAGLAGVTAAILSIIALVTAASGVGLPIAIAVSGLASAILAAIAALGDLTYTETVWDELKCIIFCHLTDEGKVDDYEGIISDILEKEGVGLETQWEIIRLTVEALGKQGLDNAAALGLVGEGDCDCGCVDCATLSFTYRFEPNPDPEESYAILIGSLGAGYDGQGVVSQYIGAGYGEPHAFEFRIRVPLDPACQVVSINSRQKEVATPSQVVAWNCVAEVWRDGVMVATKTRNISNTANGAWVMVPITFDTPTSGDELILYSWNRTSSATRNFVIHMDDLGVTYG